MIPVGGGRFVRPTCDACGREFRSGVMVAWEVLGDPRDIVEVCEECVEDAVASEIVGEIAEAERLRALAVWSLAQFDWLRGGKSS